MQRTKKSVPKTIIQVALGKLLEFKLNKLILFELKLVSVTARLSVAVCHINIHMFQVSAIFAKVVLLMAPNLEQCCGVIIAN